ncbi:MAG: RNA-directed DNA polymerase [Eubacteriales bacterium]
MERTKMPAITYDHIYSFQNLYRAFLMARRGKRGNESVMKFEANLLEAIHLLSEMLQHKTYSLSDYFTFVIYEPKERIVMTNSFKDKVVQHSLCDNVLEPMLESTFIKSNSASQKGKGTHYGLDLLTKDMRSFYFRRKAIATEHCQGAGLPYSTYSGADFADGWVLKCDVTKFFYKIPHEKLKQDMRKHIQDPDILWLVDLIIDSTDNVGIPIGNQTSQWFAVLYLSDLDHFIKEKLHIEHYGRYMDDFYLIHDNKHYLKYCLLQIEAFTAEKGLTLNNKTNIFPLKNGIDFLGFHSYLTDSGKVIRKVRQKSKTNRKRVLKKLRQKLDFGEITLEEVEHSYGSWRTHALHGNSYHLVQDMDKYFKELFKESEKKWRKH